MPKGVYKRNEEQKQKLRILNINRVPWNKGKKRPPFSEEWKRKMGLANKGKKQSEETKLKRSLTLKGRKFSEETKKKISLAATGRKVSKETRLKLSEFMKKRWLNINYKEKHSKLMSKLYKEGRLDNFIKGNKKSKGPFKTSYKPGKEHPMWKGGTANLNKIIRNTYEYQKWRKSVFERDNFTCQHCFKRGGYLEVHHIKPFANYPDLRFEIDNGLTLCKLCHKKLPLREKLNVRKCLIGSLTFFGKEYILDRWVKRVLELKIPKDFEVEILIVDNTNDNGEYAQSIRDRYKLNVIHEKYLEETNANIANSRNRLRKYILDNNFDYLFMLEIDVIPQIDTLYELAKHNLPVVSSYYFIGQGMRYKRHCIVMPFIPVEEARKLPENHIEMSLAKDKLVRVLQGSMGCCLIKKNVLQKINFFYLHAKNNYIVHDDTFFFVECEIHGIPVYVDSTNIVAHFQSDWWKEFMLKREAEKNGDSENQNIISKEVN